MILIKTMGLSSTTTRRTASKVIIYIDDDNASPSWANEEPVS